MKGSWSELYYTGIGSRNTPENILQMFENIAKHLGKNNFILRSGGANGADSSFEKGCDEIHGKKEIYLPWKNFNDSSSTLVVHEEEAFTIAEQFHPCWKNLKNSAKKLQARNSHQVLGMDLNTKSEFVVCYTKDGKGKGGTGQAVRIAKAHSIPIFDAGEYKNLDEFKKKFWTYLKKNYNLSNEKNEA